MTDDMWRNVMNAYYVSSTEMVAAECWLSVSARIRILRVSLENLDILSLSQIIDEFQNNTYWDPSLSFSSHCSDVWSLLNGMVYFVNYNSTVFT